MWKIRSNCVPNSARLRVNPVSTACFIAITIMFFSGEAALARSEAEPHVFHL